MPNLLNGLRVYTVKETGAKYIPLPKDAWSPALPLEGGESPCDCPYCKGANSYWDTLVIPGKNDRSGTTFTVHMPQLQVGDIPVWLKRE